MSKDVSLALRVQEVGNVIHAAAEVRKASLTSLSIQGVISWMSDSITSIPNVDGAWIERIKPAIILVLFISREDASFFSGMTAKRAISGLQKLWTAAWELGKYQEQKSDCVILSKILQTVNRLQHIYNL